MSSPYVVITTQRTGSTWLMDVINNMPNSIGQGELFLERHAPAADQWDAAFAYPRFAEARSGHRPLSTWKYLADFYNQSGHVGFKLMYSQLRTIPEIWAYLQALRVPAVHLVRTNYLDMLISSRTKAQLGRAHYLAGEEVPSEFTVTINPETVTADLGKLRKQQSIARRVLATSIGPVWEVAYEDLVGEPSTFEAIWEFLGIDARGEMPESQLLRIQRRSHSEVVRDADRVRSAILDSEFAGLWRSDEPDGPRHSI